MQISVNWNKIELKSIFEIDFYNLKFSFQFIFIYRWWNRGLYGDRDLELHGLINPIISNAEPSYNMAKLIYLQNYSSSKWGQKKNSQFTVSHECSLVSLKMNNFTLIHVVAEKLRRNDFLSLQRKKREYMYW